MDSYRSILEAGGKTNSLGRADEVIADVYVNPDRLKELFNCIFVEDAWVRMRAIDSFEKIAREKPEWITEYIEVIFNDLAKSMQPSIQWHLAQLFCEVQLTDDQRGRAIAWLKQKIATADVDWIVSVNVMKALMYFYQNQLVETDELKELLNVQTKHASQSVRKKAVEFYERLNQ